MTGASLGIPVLLAAVLIILGILHRRRKHRQNVAASAMASFGGQRAALERLFLQQAQATGKPRGLRWVQCELTGTPVFARDRQSGEIVALVEATIGFEAIPGGDMEDVEAVGNLRSGTVVFVHRKGIWTSDGRAVFNLNPEQTLARFAATLSHLD